MKKYNLNNESDLLCLNNLLIPTKFSIIEEDKRFLLKKNSKVQCILPCTNVTKIQILNFFIQCSEGKNLLKK
jgi:hypothetical protein